MNRVRRGVCTWPRARRRSSAPSRSATSSTCSAGTYRNSASTVDEFLDQPGTGDPIGLRPFTVTHFMSTPFRFRGVRRSSRGLRAEHERAGRNSSSPSNRGPVSSSRRWSTTIDSPSRRRGPTPPPPGRRSGGVRRPGRLVHDPCDVPQATGRRRWSDGGRSEACSHFCGGKRPAADVERRVASVGIPSGRPIQSKRNLHLCRWKQRRHATRTLLVDVACRGVADFMPTYLVEVIWGGPSTASPTWLRRRK